MSKYRAIIAQGLALMKILPSIIIILLSLTTGCATMKHNYIPSTKRIDFPRLNTQTTVYIGDAMIMQGEFTEIEFLRIQENLDNKCYKIPSDDYKKEGEDAKNMYFSATGVNDSIRRDTICDPITGIYIKKNDYGQIHIITIIGHVLSYDAVYRINTTDRLIGNTTKKTFFFSGIKNNDVTFSYTKKNRFDNVHLQNISYNLKDGNIINYQGAQIKILDVTTQSITYSVIKKFSK